MAKTTVPPKHPLVGAGVHWCLPDGYVQNQASIVAIVPSNSPAGDLALLQYYEWIMGEPSTRRLVSLARLQKGWSAT